MSILSKLFAKNLPDQASQPNELEVIESHTKDLYAYIGSWPPHFNSEGHKTEVFGRWKRLVVMAQRIYEERQDQEELCLCLLADLFRLGHNMDAQNSAQNAHQALTICLGKYPNSVRANFIAAYFYISLSPQAAVQGEACLLKLRELFKPETNPEVERWYLFSKISQNDLQQALAQAELYLRTFGPNSEVAKIKESIVSGNFKPVHRPGTTAAT